MRPSLHLRVPSEKISAGESTSRSEIKSTRVVKLKSKDTGPLEVDMLSTNKFKRVKSASKNSTLVPGDKNSRETSSKISSKKVSKLKHNKKRRSLGNLKAGEVSSQTFDDLEDSVLLEAIVQEANGGRGAQALMSGGLAATLGSVPMMDLLTAYDNVIKSHKCKSVEPAQATRIYRKLLKLQREAQIDRQTVYDLEEIATRTEDGGLQISGSIDLVNRTSAMERSSSSAIDIRKETGLLGFGKNTQSHQELAVSPSLGGRMQKQMSVGNLALKQQADHGRNKLPKPGKPPSRQPPARFKKLLKPTENSISHGDTMSTQLSLPKLSFADLLNRPPRPNENVPQPSTQTPSSLDRRGYQSLLAPGIKTPSSISNPAIFIDPETKRDASDERQYMQLDEHPRLYTGSTESNYQSYTEFTLKPDIGQFGTNPLSQLMSNDDSRSLHHIESSEAQTNSKPAIKTESRKNDNTALTIIDEYQSGYQEDSALHVLGVEEKSINYDSLNYPSMRDKRQAPVSHIQTGENIPRVTSEPMTAHFDRRAQGISKSITPNQIISPVFRESPSYVVSPESFQVFPVSSQQHLKVELNCDLLAIRSSRQSFDCQAQPDYVPLRQKSRGPSRDMNQLRSLETIISGGASQAQSRSKSHDSRRSGHHPLRTKFVSLRSASAAASGSEGEHLSQGYPTLSRSGHDQFRRQQAEFNMLEQQIEDEYSRMEDFAREKHHAAQQVISSRYPCSRVSNRELYGKGGIDQDLDTKRESAPSTRVAFLSELTSGFAPGTYKHTANTSNHALPLSSDDLANYYHAKNLCIKAFKILCQKRLNNQNIVMFDHLSRSFRYKHLVEKAFHRLGYFTKVVLPQQRKMIVAGKQHTIVTKLKVLRELKRYKEYKIFQAERQVFAETNINRNLAKRVLDSIVNHAAQSAIKRSMYSQACRLRRRHLLKTAYLSLYFYKDFLFNLHQVKNKARNIFRYKTLRKTMKCLKIYKTEKKIKKKLEGQCDQHLKHTVWPGQRLIVFIALSKFAKKSKSDRLANHCNKKWIQYRAFSVFKEGIIISQNIQNQKAISLELYDLKLQQVGFKALVENIKLTRRECRRMKEKVDSLRLRKMFNAFDRVRRIAKLIYPMSHPMQLKCACLWLEASFGRLMESVWSEFPDNQVKRLRQVQDGKVDVMVPNYLEVSKNKRSLSFYYQVNNFMAQDLLKAAFCSLARNRHRMRSYRKARRFREQNVLFKSLVAVCRSHIILKRFLIDLEAERREKSLASVFYTLHERAQARTKATSSFYQVLQQRKGRLLAKHLGTWRIRYLKNVRVRQLKAMSLEFVTERSIRKYMGLWVGKLKKRLKKRYLYTVVFPKVQQNQVIDRLFTNWLELYKRHKYLDEQIQSINQHQKNEYVTSCFAKLATYAKMKRGKKTMSDLANQQYLYSLGRRVFGDLSTNAAAEGNKRVLYKSIRLDFLEKRARQVVFFLQEYNRVCKEKQINKLILTKEITKLRVKNYTKQWLRVFQRRQSLRFIETTLDFARLGIAFGRISSNDKQNVQNIKKSRSQKVKHLERQYFTALRTHLLSKKLQRCNFELVSVSLNPKLCLRYLKYWHHALARRNQNFLIADWTIIQIARQKMKSAFVDLKAYTRRRRYKRLGPQIRGKMLLQMALAALCRKAQRSQSCALLFQIQKKRSDDARKSLILRYWKFRLEEALILADHHQRRGATTTRLAFSQLREYSQRKRERRVELRQRQEALTLYLRDKAFTKFVCLVQGRQEGLQKQLIAECFNNQYMYNMSFRAWVAHYRAREPAIERIREARAIRSEMLVRQMLRLWREQSWRPLNKIKAVRRLSLLGARSHAKQLIKIWLSEAKRLTELEGRLEAFVKYKGERDLEVYFKSFAQTMVAKGYRRKKLGNARQFYSTKLRERAIDALRKFIEMNRQLQEYESLADAQFASVVIERYFVILRYITHQRRLLRAATQTIHRVRRLQLAPGLFESLSLNVQRNRELAELTERADVFHNCKLMERSCIALVQHRFENERKTEMVERALQFHAMCLVVNHFNALRAYVENKAVHNERREIMHQVVKTVDRAHLTQLAFDALFKNQVRGSEEFAYTIEHLTFSKKRRMFKILQWNRDRNKLCLAASQAIKQQQEESRRCKFFFQWRTRYMEVNLVQTYMDNKRQEVVKGSFRALQRHFHRQRNLKLCLGSRKVGLLYACLEALRRNVRERRVRKSRTHEASVQYSRGLAVKSLRALYRHRDLGLKYKAVIENRQNVSLVRGFMSWLNLGLLTRRRTAALRKVMDAKLARLCSLTMKQWSRQSRFKKTCEVMHSAYGLQFYLTAEFKNEIRESAFNALKRYSRKQRAIRESYLLVKDKHETCCIRKLLRDLKRSVKDRVICYRMRALVRNVRGDAFAQLKAYSDKDAKLQAIGKEVRYELEHATKSRILYQWALANDKRENVYRFVLRRKFLIKKQAFMGFKENLILKNESKLQQLRIISYFGEKRPEVLQIFSKAFLHLSFDLALLKFQNQYVLENLVDPDLTFSYFVPHQTNLSKISASNAEKKALFDSQDMVSEENQIFIEASDIQGFHGAKICNTVLLKYFLEKWRLSLPELKRRRQIKRTCREHYELKRLSTVLTTLRRHSLLKAKGRQVVQQGREFFLEVQLKKSFVHLREYALKRRQIEQLKQVGEEICQIRSSSCLHKHMLKWYQLTIEELQIQDKYENIIEQFRAMQDERRYAACLFALKKHIITGKRERKQLSLLREDSEGYAASFYKKALLSKTMQVLSDHAEENREFYELPKEYREQLDQFSKK